MYSNKFFRALNIRDDVQLKMFAKVSGVSIKNLRYYDETGTFPTNRDLQAILSTVEMSELEFKIRLGILDNAILDALFNHSNEITHLIGDSVTAMNRTLTKNHQVAFQTDFGTLYQGDCLSLMSEIESESLDLIFADPPFNLDKSYESGIDDNITQDEYLRWTEKWVLKCVDLLKEGGSLFIWNLPKWNTYIASILNQRLTFKHWIAVDIKYRLPIKNRLYPSHYSLLYYTKGEKKNTFNEQRLPLEICRHCGGDIRDYGGYKDKLNPEGINLTDVWYDIPPVRHSKYKTRNSNELSMKLLERIISLASNEGDTVFDPFGGSGTTYIVSEILNRKWIGVEIGPIDSIIDRFNDINHQIEYINEIKQNKNTLFTQSMRKLRLKNGHWLPETLKKKNNKQL